MSPSVHANGVNVSHPQKGDKLKGVSLRWISVYRLLPSALCGRISTPLRTLEDLLRNVQLGVETNWKTHLII